MPHNLKPGAKLQRVYLCRMNLNDIDLRRSDLLGADLGEAKLRRANLSETNLSEAYMQESDLSQANLSKAILANADLKKANLSKANLAEADLCEADLRQADLRDANLSWTNLRGAIIDESTQISEKWRLVWKIVNQCNAEQDLSGVDLSNANLEHINMFMANLFKANLSDALLVSADLRGANLQEANLRGANLLQVDLKVADLRGADLRGANLTNAELEVADFRDAKLDEATKLVGVATDEKTQGLTYNEEYLRHYNHQCWDEIKRGDRRYAIPSNGRAEIMVSDELSQRLGLISIQFIQEGIAAPGVFLKFRFADNKFDTITIEPDGIVSGFHRNTDNEAIIEAIALSYYRDLVTPGETYFYQPGSGSHHRKISPFKLKTPRKLPRPQMIPLSKSEPYRFREWYNAQERARHNVVGHARRQGNGPSWEKQQQAREAGVELPSGYTWVKEHKRGSGEGGRLRLNGTDLVEHTLFAPPERASIELNNLL